jgi:hypothetical protein
MANAALTVLAADARNAGLVLSLADPAKSPQPGAWPARLIASLIDAGNFTAAHEVWRRAARLTPTLNEPIFDSGFKGSDALPPFNWTLASSTLGLSERRPAGTLHVIYYGQDDGVLAAQLLLLSPGRYRLSAEVSGTRPGALAWIVTCAGASGPLARLPLDPAAAANGVGFIVPVNCRAQKLELAGQSSDMPQQTDVSIRALRLERLSG